jgi:hypothetical protein
MPLFAFQTASEDDQAPDEQKESGGGGGGLSSISPLPYLDLNLKLYDSSLFRFKP